MKVGALANARIRDDDDDCDNGGVISAKAANRQISVSLEGGRANAQLPLPGCAGTHKSGTNQHCSSLLLCLYYSAGSR